MANLKIILIILGIIFTPLLLVLYIAANTFRSEMKKWAKDNGLNYKYYKPKGPNSLNFNYISGKYRGHEISVYDSINDLISSFLNSRFTVIELDGKKLADDPNKGLARSLAPWNHILMPSKIKEILDKNILN